MAQSFTCLSPSSSTERLEYFNCVEYFPLLKQIWERAVTSDLSAHPRSTGWAVIAQHLVRQCQQHSRSTNYQQLIPQLFCQRRPSVHTVYYGGDPLVPPVPTNSAQVCASSVWSSAICVPCVVPHPPRQHYSMCIISATAGAVANQDPSPRWVLWRLND